MPPGHAETPLWLELQSNEISTVCLRIEVYWGTASSYKYWLCPRDGAFNRSPSDQVFPLSAMLPHLGNSSPGIGGDMGKALKENAPDCWYKYQ